MFTLSNQYGRKARILHWCAEQAITKSLEEMDLTSAQGHVMAFLSHAKTPPCPRDLEEAFQLSHPTVSGLLSRLEKKGFIAMCPDESDRRCKRIHVLPKGMECHDKMHETINSIENRVVEGFTPEEQAQFSELLDRAIANLGGCPHPHKHKEEQTE